MTRAFPGPSASVAVASLHTVNVAIQSAQRGHISHTFSCPHRKFMFCLVAMIALRHAPACEHRTCARLLYHGCDNSTFSIYSTTAQAVIWGTPNNLRMGWDRQRSSDQQKVMEVSAYYCINQDSRDK